MTLLLPSICLFGCGLSLWFEAHENSKLTIKTKLLASLAFVGFAWQLGAWNSHYGQMIFMGLVLSMVGDVLLAMKNKPQAFLVGICAFLLAHVLYALAFIDTGMATAKLPLVLPVTLLFMLGIGLWLHSHLSGIFKVAVPVYLLAIGVMLVLAWTNQANPGWIWIVSVASLFALSDVFVARQRFIQADIRNRIIGLPIYYVAQLLLAYSVLYL